MSNSSHPTRFVLRCRSTTQEKAWKTSGCCLQREGTSYVVDKLLDESANHEQFYDEAIKDWMPSTLEGHSLTIAAYGPSCVGKTYTVFGNTGKSRVDPSAKGVIVRCAEQLLDEIRKTNPSSSPRTRMTASFCHVFSDGRIADLLDTKKRNLQVVEAAGSTGSYYVDGITEMTVSSVQEIVRLVEKVYLMRNATGVVRKPVSGERRLTIRDPMTSMVNQYKPHCTHCLCQLKVEHMLQTDQSSANDPHADVATACVSIVDMAGGSVEAFLNESVSSDTSVTALHQALDHLATGNTQRASAVSLSAPLPKIMYPSLFGNGRLILIVNASIDQKSSELTKRTFEFAKKLSASKNFSNAVYRPLMETNLGRLLSERDSKRKEIARLCDVDSIHAWETMDFRSVKINGTVYDKLPPKCEESVKHLMEVETQLFPPPTSMPMGSSTKPMSSLKIPLSWPLTLPSMTPVKQTSLPPMIPTVKKPPVPPTGIKRAVSKPVQESSSSEDSSSDNDAKKPMSPGPPPPPLRGIPHIKGPATPSSRPSTPLTPATHAPNLSELISALRAGQEINLSNISPPQAGPSSGVVREKLRNSTLAKTPRPKNTNSACTSSNESLSSSEKTKNVRKKLKKKSFHLSPRKPALARSFESELTKLPGKMVEKLPATAVAPSGQHPQRNDVLSPSVHHLVSSSTSTISSDSDGDMETRDKFDPDFQPQKRLRLQPLNLGAPHPWRQVDSLPLIQALPPISMSPTSPQHAYSPQTLHSPQPTTALSDHHYWHHSHQQQRGETVILPSYAQVQQERREQQAHSQSNQQQLGSTGEYMISNEEIHVAAMEGVKTSTLKRLIMRKGVDYRDDGNRTPLMYAVLGNQPKMCEVLLQAEADVNIRDSSGYTPLLWAAFQAKSEVMKVLLKNGADAHAGDSEGRTSYHWAMKTPNIQCLKLLCKYASDSIQNQPDHEGLSPLHWGVMCEQPNHIQVLLTFTPSTEVNSLDNKGRTPLNYAVLNYSPACIKAILDSKESAIKFRDLKGRTSLHYACAESSADCVRTLLSFKSCDIQATDGKGTTPLHWATAANQPGIVQLLLRRGADRGQTDNENMAPVDYARQRELTECVKILENYGIHRPSSAWSIASQFSVPPTTPPELDKYGHVPMKRPNQNLFSSAIDFSASSLDRMPADGQEEQESMASTAERGGPPPDPEPRQVLVIGRDSRESVADIATQNGLNQRSYIPQSSSLHETSGSRMVERGRWRSVFCGICSKNSNVVVPVNNE